MSRDKNDWIANLIKEVTLATKRYVAGKITRGEREAIYDTAYDAIHNYRQQLVKEIREAVEGMRKNARPSIRSLRFGDCPSCGQKSRREWVDNETIEIKKEALDDILALPELREE